MPHKEHIRNIGIIAHIDHGKTTLADSLLAGAGLLSPQMAGMARVLDYLEEEQKRKITIKTANAALLYNSDSESYLVNLVDTPGHVDFTGKVTRALRVIDGAVIVVDAVEEIMAQTEILTRQALEERVRPVLFINKVDRLITELMLNEEQIQKKLDRIIGAFNDLIELYAEPEFRSEWKIHPSKGNVAFGASLHGWGFTLETARKAALKFQDLIAGYKNHTYMKLAKKLPVYEAIFSMAINAVPSPKVAQSYRIGKIWSGALDSEAGRGLIECSDLALAVAFVTKVQADIEGMTVATVRVFSGKITPGCRLYGLDAAAEMEVNSVLIDLGAIRDEIAEASAGNLVTLNLTGKVRAGETLVAVEAVDIAPFECVHYVSEPVVTLAVEPKNPQQIASLQRGLEKITVEDPNLKAMVDEQTGEYLLSGMGELHLEVAINQLKDFGVDVTVSSPRVVYVESVQREGVVALAKSGDKLNCFWVEVEPAQQKHDVEEGSVLCMDDQGNILVDCKNKVQTLSTEIQEAVKAGFNYAVKAGPLCSEPMHNVKVNLVNFALSSDSASDIEVMHGVGKAVFGSFLTAHPALMEPIYKIEVTVASELAGETSRIIQTRRGKVSQFNQKGQLTQIVGCIPVAETFGFSKELRSATSGRAVWQSIFDHWECLPQRLADGVISELRSRKGLASDVPKPEKFME
jgi:elongation factor 2